MASFNFNDAVYGRKNTRPDDSELFHAYQRRFQEAFLRQQGEFYNLNTQMSRMHPVLNAHLQQLRAALGSVGGGDQLYFVGDTVNPPGTTGSPPILEGTNCFVEQACVRDGVPYLKVRRCYAWVDYAMFSRTPPMVCSV